MARSARRIARVLDVDAAAYVERAEAMGAEAFVEALVLREDDALEVLPAFREVPGALAVRDTLPLAPTREFAAALLGRVGPATAEIVEESDGRIVAGDEVGLSGLQARYDDQLRGSPGTAVVARDDERPAAHPLRGRPPPTAPTSSPPSTPPCSRTPRTRWRPSATTPRPPRSWRSGPRTAPSWRRPTAPARRARTWPTPATTPPARPSRSSARWRCCAAASRSTTGWRARRRRSSTAGPSRTTTTTRVLASVTSP